VTTYFCDKTFKFLRSLARHNERTWFQDHKADYDEHLRLPFLRLIGDLQAPLAKISTHYRADPRPVGGSLFRIHRDTRFANDKTPYKTWSGARCFHERHREVEAPSFYLHVQPGNCFVGAGLWHPETATLRRIRDFLIENPEAWKRAVHGPAFRRRFEMGGESLTRPPRGYPADHELIEDLKRKSFVCWRALDEETVLGPKLLGSIADEFRASAPLVDYLCAALDLEF
jgi:uncharacterized protein (TIGR02453 family)